MNGRDLLVAADDASSRSALTRLAAVAGVQTRAVGRGELRTLWPTAAAVVVDASCARWCAEAGLDRRSGVLLVEPGDCAPQIWQLAVAVGAERVLCLAREEREVVAWLAEAREPDAVGRLLCCVSARAGCGASTLACALALAAAARGADALLVDGDPPAGGLDYVLGAERLDGARWDALAGTAGVLPAAVLADALPALGRLRILSGAASWRAPLPVAAVRSVVAAGIRGHATVIADAPPDEGDVATLLTARADTVLVVVPAEVRAVVAAAGTVAAVAQQCGHVGLVVRQPGPGGLRPRDVADAVGVPVAAVWPWDRRLGVVVEGGRFARDWRRTGVGRLADRLLDELAPA